MRKLLFFLLIAIIPGKLFSQDTLFFKNGQVITAIIVEKNNVEIKYRRYGPPESPAIYSVFTADLLRVHYKDGIIADYSRTGVTDPGAVKERAVDMAGTIKVMKLSIGAGADNLLTNEQDALLRFWRDMLNDPNALIGGNGLSFPIYGKFGAQFNRVAFGAELQLMMTPKDGIYASEFNGTYEIMFRNFYYNIGIYIGRTLNHKRNLLIVIEPGVDLTFLAGHIKIAGTEYDISATSGTGWHIASGLDWQMTKRLAASLRGGYRSLTSDEYHKNENSTTGFSRFYVDRDVSDELLTISWKGPYVSAGLTWSFYFKLN